MFAFMMDLNDLSPWGLAGREYLRALAPAGNYVIRPFGGGTLWYTSAANIGQRDRTMLDEQTERLVFGQGRWRNPPEVMFYHGPLAKVAGEESIAPPPGGTLIAIVDFNGDITEDQVESLKRFDAIWVPYAAQETALNQMGLDHVFVTPPPVRLELAQVQALKPTVRAAVAFGDESWCSKIVKQFTNKNKGDPTVGLYCVVHDEITLALEKLEENIAIVSLDTRIPDSIEWWSALLRAADCFVSDSRLSYLNEVADFLGCTRRVGGLDGAIISPEKVEPPSRAILRLFAALEDSCELAALRLSKAKYKLGTVIHYNDDLEALFHTLRCLRPAIIEGEPIIIANSGTPDQHLLILAHHYGALVVSARNGPRKAIEFGSELLLFLEAGILVNPAAVWMMRLIIEGQRTENSQEVDGATVMTLLGKKALSADELPCAEWPWPGDDEPLDRRSGYGHLMVRASTFQFFGDYPIDCIALRNHLRSSYSARWIDEFGVTVYCQPSTRP